MAKNEYTPDRIEKAIRGYKRDIERIKRDAQENGQEMMRLKERRASDLACIEDLQSKNEGLLGEWKMIAGKIELLEELLQG